jgi:predicted TIM-barrel fold metal-dependent hydrolase
VSLDVPIADAHLHVWDPRAHYYPWLCDERPITFRYGDYAALRRPYLVADYRADSAGWPVAAGVYVEAEWDPRDPAGEMDFVAASRAAHGFPTVAIAQAWLHRSGCAELLEAHAARGFVRGVRHKPAPGMMDDAGWRAGYEHLAGLGLHFELQAPWTQLAEAARLARAFPDTALVLNHTGLPADRTPEGLAGWRAALRELAACPNASAKISGLGVPGAPWTAEANRAIVLTAIELFGAQRAMFASNFPVDGLCASFDTIFAGFDAITRGFTRAERRALFHDNAARLYRMEQTHG